MDDLKIGNLEHGLERKWYTTKKGNTTEVTCFVVAIPNDENDMFHDVLKDIIRNNFIKVFKFWKTNTAGELPFSFTELLTDPNRHDTGMYNWLGTAKEKKDPKLAATVMTKEIHNHFKGGWVYDYDVSLDMFIVDFNIKEFLNNHVEINSCDNLDQDGRKACFRDYPT